MIDKFGKVKVLQMRQHSLRQTDWCVLPDSPLKDSERSEIVTYRQEWRDITDQFSLVSSIDEIQIPSTPVWFRG